MARTINRRLTVLPPTTSARRADGTEIGWTHANGYEGETQNRGLVAYSVEEPQQDAPAPQQDSDDKSAAPPSPDDDDESVAPPGPNEDDAGLDPRDGRGIEDELERMITSLADDHSELAAIKVLPRAKELYERLHPETKHGGDREEQVADSATWPGFTRYVADRTGISQRTVYNRLGRAESLATLDKEAEEACYGTPIANQIGLLVRIAAIPKVTLHRDLVNVYRSAGPKKAKEELRKWEDQFGLAKKPKPKPDPTPESSEPTESSDSENTGPSDPTDEGQGQDDAESQVAEILSALGVNAIEECVPEIDKLKALAASPAHDDQEGTLQATIYELQAGLQERDHRIKKLEQELTLFRNTPLGDLFKILGVTSAKEALRQARSLMEAHHAAE